MTTFAGGDPSRYASADGTGEHAWFKSPNGLAFDTAGNLYVTDPNSIRKITTAAVVTTLAGVVIGSTSDDDTGSIQRGGACLEQELGDFLPVPARDQRATSPDVLGKNRKRDAERRLPEDIHLINVRAFADQVADDIGQSLVSGRMQRGLAVLEARVHGSIFAQQPAPSPVSPASATTNAEATAERVIVTGSNIPTAEETGPNPVRQLL